MNRNTIDPSLRNWTEWPTLNAELLPPKRADIVHRRIEAVKLYLEGKSLAIVKEQTHIARDKVYALFNACLAMHSDGRIWGFRACGYYVHTKIYRRINIPTVEKQRRTHGFSGQLGHLFSRFPWIAESLMADALKSRRKGFTESAIRLDKLHQQFLELCRKAEIRDNEYPFCVESQGERSVARWVKAEMLKRNLRRTVDIVYGEDVARRLNNMGDAVRGGDVKVCFDRVEFDGHKIDAFATIEVPSPTGGEPVLLVVERIWILAAIDVASRAVLGYHIAFGRHYTAEDVLTCLENCIVPWKPRKLRANGLSYPNGSGFPSGSIPELAYAKWNELAFDNDKSNCAMWVWERVRSCIGSSLNPGPIKTPESRQFIERFFRSLAQNGPQRLPITTGSSSKDPRRQDPEQKATDYRVHLEDLLDFTDVILASYNATPTTALHGRSPLEYLRFALQRDSFIVRQIPEAERPHFALALLNVQVKVRGKIKTGERPYVRYMGVRYYSERLSNSPSLIGQKITLQVKVRDLRIIRLYLEDGQEFGDIVASQEWAGTAHDLRTRKAILKCIRRGRIARRGIPDVVAEFIRYKETHARTSRKARNELAHLRRVRRQGGRQAPVTPVRPLPPPKLVRPKALPIKLKRRFFNF